MSFVSKAALAAVLALGAAGGITAPAFAQEEKEAPKVEVSEEFRKAAVAAETALKAQDWATAEAQLNTAASLAKNDYEKYFVAALRLPLEGHKKDEAALIRTLDELLTNPHTPQTDLGRFNWVRGSLAFNAKKYPEAIQYLNRARELGYSDENLPLYLARSKVESGDVPGGISELEKAIQAKQAAGQKAPEEWYSYAVAKLYGAGNRAAAAEWLRRTIEQYPTAQNWRKAILVYRESAGANLDKGARLDTFRLMRATKSLADQSDYLAYAELAYQVGLPFETKAVLEEGKASGKLPSGAGAKLSTDAAAAIKREASLNSQEAKAKAASKGAPSAQMGDVYLASGDYAKAAELYRLALQKGGVNANEVNTRLGIALANSGQKAAAKQAFAAVNAKPRSDIAAFWTLWLDTSGGAAAAPAASAATTTGAGGAAAR